MFKGLGNIGGLMKSAMEFQSRLGTMDDSLADVRVEGAAGGGMVTVEATAQPRVIRCQIEEAVFTAGDKEMIEELVVAAVNQALDKSKQAQAEEMSRMTGDLNLPDLGDALQQMGMGGLPGGEDHTKTET